MDEIRQVVEAANEKELNKKIERLEEEGWMRIGTVCYIVKNGMSLLAQTMVTQNHVFKSEDSVVISFLD